MAQQGLTAHSYADSPVDFGLGHAPIPLEKRASVVLRISSGNRSSCGRIQ